MDPNNLKNYRPISNLPFLSKLLEKTVLCQLQDHLKSNDLYSPFQSAYRTGHSTETALTHVTNDLLAKMDDGKISMVVLLDLSAAFDTIDHEILLARLQSYFGVDGTALAWLRSYITGRMQFVSVLGYDSEPVPLSFGVPQGSVLGPVLFIMYTKPLSDLIAKHPVKHQSFADDTQLNTSFDSCNIDSAIEIIQHCTNDIQSWMVQNKLQLNEGKTEALLVSTSTSDKDLPTSIQIGSSVVPFVKSVRNLGVILDRRLSMKEHINKVCQMAYWELRRISSIRQYLTEDAAKTLVVSLVLSRLDYGNCLLAGVPECLLHKLKKIQNASARLILKSSRQEHTKPLLKSLHWLPISDRITYKLSCMCYNSVTASTPQYLADLLQIYTPSRTLRSTTDTRKLKIPLFKKKYSGQRSFSYQGPVTWNNLPFSIRHTQTYSSFKSQLKTHLFSQTFQ